jgi:DNA-binding CsgD family transcriptional regulator
VLRNNIHLTERQQTVLNLFLSGKLEKIIALELQIGASSVGTHLWRIRQKFGVHSNRELYSLCAANHGSNVPAELAQLRAEAVGFEAWRKTLVKEISLATAQRDAALRELEELKAIPAVQQALARRDSPLDNWHRVGHDGCP